MLDSILDSEAASLPSWVDAAIALIEPLLQVMARPVVVNNLRRVALDPARPTPAELLRFMARIEASITTFTSREQARSVMPPLRQLLHLQVPRVELRGRQPAH